VYPGINKPVAVIDWLANTEVRRLSARICPRQQLLLLLGC